MYGRYCKLACVIKEKRTVIIWYNKYKGIIFFSFSVFEKFFIGLFLEQKPQKQIIHFSKCCAYSYSDKG